MGEDVGEGKWKWKGKVEVVAMRVAEESLERGRTRQARVVSSSSTVVVVLDVATQ